MFRYQTFVSSDHDVFSVHRLNLVVYNLIYACQIRSDSDIYSIAYCFLTVKQIGEKGFSKMFNFFISTLI